MPDEIPELSFVDFWIFLLESFLHQEKAKWLKKGVNFDFKTRVQEKQVEFFCWSVWSEFLVQKDLSEPNTFI